MHVLITTLVPRIRNLPSGIAQKSSLEPAFHDTNTDILARILADTSDTRDFLKLFLQAERHADILATILARMSVSESWNAGLTEEKKSDVERDY